MTGSTVRETARVDRAEVRVGAAFTIVGAVAFAVVRTLHGDTPGADPVASLAFVRLRPLYAAVHIAAVFAALLTMCGLVVLTRSLTTPVGRVLARLGLSSALVGLGIFGVESTSEGLALPELARTSMSASPQERGELVRAAHAVLTVTHGPSLVAVALLYGVPLVAFGTAIVADDHPAWLGWAGIGVGGLTLVAATGEYLDPDLMPGFLIYGLLASFLAQLWLIAMAVTLLTGTRDRRSRRLRVSGGGPHR